jgi:hypothetical protein
MDTGDTLDDLIDAVPWGRLAHAYDAALDAPPRLRELAAAVERGTSEGLDLFEDWLLYTVVHQGTPYSATAPVLWIARRILGDGSTHPALAWCMEAVAECAKALRWAAEHAAGPDGREHELDEPEPQRSGAQEPLWATYLPPARALPPKTGDRVSDDYFLAAPADPRTLTACVEDWERTVVDCLRGRRFLDASISAASALLQLAPSVPLAEAMRPLVDELEDNELRAASAFALAASRHGIEDFDALIGHQDRAVRVAAALGRPDDPRSIGTLVPAAADRGWVRSTFPGGFVGPEPWLGAALLAAVLDRVSAGDADALLINGLERQLATVAYGPLGASSEWGPILAWLFPDRWRQNAFRDVPRSDELSPTQRRLLSALARNDDPWSSGAGNAALALGQVGLPHDRGVVAAIAGVRLPRRGVRWPRRTR